MLYSAEWDEMIFEEELKSIHFKKTILISFKIVVIFAYFVLIPMEMTTHLKEMRIS